MFGTGVNLAARVESKTEPGHVLINAEFKNNLANAWGDVKANKYLSSIGMHQLKGSSKEQELFEFNWKSFAKENRAKGLAVRVFNCLEKSGAIPTNINQEDLKEPGLIIWPVVPREIVTAIHRGQIEIIRVLAFLGWKIHLLIADCGALVNPVPDQSLRFKNDILKYAKYRGLHNIESNLLSEFFDNSYENQKEVLEKFRKISIGLKVQDLIHINQKDYSEEVKAKIKGNPTLDFLRPVLTGAAVLHLSDKFKTVNGKVIVIAGHDEEIQWRHIIENDPRSLAVIYNPRLEELDKSGIRHTARQSGKWPIWFSKIELKSATNETNALKWICHLFAQLPSFPSTEVIVNEEVLCNNCDFENTSGSCNRMDKLIDHVWPMLNPAN